MKNVLDRVEESWWDEESQSYRDSRIDAYHFFMLVAENHQYDKSFRFSYYGWSVRKPVESRRRLNTFKDWKTFQLVSPNTKWSNGPEAYRQDVAKWNGSPVKDAGWLERKRFVVFDLDEMKTDKVTGEIIGKQRTPEQIADELPDGILCLVPTKTEGNWQAWYALETSIPGDTLKGDKHWYASVAHWGGDPHFYDNTLAWNPIYRTFDPDRQTLWNVSLFESGTVPTVRLDDLYVPLSLVPTQTDTKTKRIYLPSEFGKMSVAHLEQAMSGMYEGDGRNRALWNYVTKVGCQRRKELGRDLTKDEVRDIANHGNNLFAEPDTPETVASQVFWFMRERPWQRQSYAAQKSAEVRRVQAVRRYLTLKAQLEDLRALQTGQQTKTLTPVQVDRAKAYTGRQKAGVAHLAYILGQDQEPLRNLLKNGKRKGYDQPAKTIDVLHYPSGELIPHPLNLIRLPDCQCLS